MSRFQGAAALKRKQPESKTPSLNEHEHVILDAIRSKRDMGIWQRDLKRETTLPDAVVAKCLKTLQAKMLIKDVVNIQSKGKKYFIGVEFKPSNELSGGEWYDGKGERDDEFIMVLKGVCLKHIIKSKVSSVEIIVDTLKKSKAFTVDITTSKIKQIVDSLVLDREVVKVTSTGFGEFATIPIGTNCYRATHRDGPTTGIMTSIPCGVCPRMNQCTPDGIISPKTCVYFEKWLAF